MKILKRFKSSVAATRARFGLTQQQMAEHLGVSASLVKLVETKRRTLSTDGFVKLAALEIELGTLKETLQKDLPPTMQHIYNYNSSSDELETAYQESRCRFEAKQLEKKLQRMQVEHEQIKESMRNIDALAGLSNLSEGMSVLIIKNRPRLIKKLKKCSLTEQARIKNQIALLYAEAALNRSIHPDYVHMTNEKPIISPLKQSNMEYTVSLINNRADCQAMIDMANDDKDALVYRKTGLLRQKQSASINTVGIEADLSAANAEITALQTVLSSLPEGNVKDDTKVKLTKAEYKKFLLEQRKNNYGTVALVEKEYNIACVEQSIVETDAFVVALTTRMNELPPA